MIISLNLGIVIEHVSRPRVCLHQFLIVSYRLRISTIWTVWIRTVTYFLNINHNLAP